MPATVKATAGLDVMSMVPAANVPVDAAVSVKIAREKAPAPSADDGQAEEGGEDAPSMSPWTGRLNQMRALGVGQRRVSFDGAAGELVSPRRRSMGGGCRDPVSCVVTSEPDGGRPWVIERRD